MAGCDDQRCASAFAFEHCVRRGRRAMVDELEGAGPADLLLQDLADFGYTILNPNALVWNRRGDFGPESLAMGREDIDVREGAADIDTQLVALNSGGVAHGQTKATMVCLSLTMLMSGEREKEGWRRRRRRRHGKRSLDTTLTQTPGPQKSRNAGLLLPSESQNLNLS